jgi:hypothetical protein
MVGMQGQSVQTTSLDEVIGQKRGLHVSLYELEAIMASRLVGV